MEQVKSNVLEKSTVQHYWFGPEKFQGTFEKDQLKHLLRRTLFGITTDDLDLFEGMSLDQVVDTLLLSVDFPSSSPINNYRVITTDNDVAFGESWVEAPAAWVNNGDQSGSVTDSRLDSMRGWLLSHFVGQQPRLHYKMVLFWHNHFAVDSGTVGIGKSMYRHFKTLWNSAYDDFKILVREITLDPGMLIVLNGTQNIKDAPDENYARELQELFCLGKGPNARFTEGDVQEAARVLTGWGVDWDTANNQGEIKSKFFDFQHETRTKKFSSFYGSKSIQGRSGANGAKELDDLIDMVVEHSETARFICRKLYRFFISPNITDAVELNFIEPLANTFINSNYEFKPVLREMFTSAHFFDTTVESAMIKSPTDLLVGFLRANKVDYFTNPGNLDNEFWVNLMLNYSLLDMGYYLGNPPSVSGWPAYYQIPSFDRLWITTFTLISRIIVSDTFINQGFWTPAERIPWDVVNFTKSLKNPEDPNELIHEMMDLNLAVILDSVTINQLKSILLNGQPQDFYWSNAWIDHLNDPQDAVKKQTIETRLKFFYTSFFQLPEFQII